MPPLSPLGYRFSVRVYSSFLSPPTTLHMLLLPGIAALAFFVIMLFASRVFLSLGSLTLPFFFASLVFCPQGLYHHCS